MKTVLITGSNGFVGKAIAENLSEDYRVIGVGRYSANRFSSNIEYHSVDISNPEQMQRIRFLENVEIIVHCAAAISSDNFNQSLIDTNVRGVENIVSYSKSVNCKHLIYISSIPIIGVPKDVPITEEHQIYPTTTYHLTKYFGEMLIQQSLPDITVTTLRLPSPVGCGSSMNTILPTFIKKCLSGEKITLLGKGERVQNYINVKDIAVSIRQVIERRVSGVYNIAYPQSYSNIELANICIKTLDSSSKIEFFGNDPEEGNKWYISIDKARKNFSFDPKISIEDTILEIAANIQNEDITT